MLENNDVIFTLSESTADYIIADLTLNKIVDKKTQYYKCVNERIDKLNREYSNRVDKILNLIILHCDFSNMPIKIISRIIMSLSRITSAISKGILSIIKE